MIIHIIISNFIHEYDLKIILLRIINYLPKYDSMLFLSRSCSKIDYLLESITYNFIKFSNLCLINVFFFTSNIASIRNIIFLFIYSIASIQSSSDLAFIIYFSIYLSFFYFYFFNYLILNNLYTRKFN